MPDLSLPKLLILNQMAGPMTWELAEDAGEILGVVAVLTGHPDTLAKGGTDQVHLYPAADYQRGSFFRRGMSWLHYAVQAFFWLWRWPRHIPILMFSNPPILCWLGWLTRVLRGQSFSVMVHDIYPDVLYKLGSLSESLSSYPSLVLVEPASLSACQGCHDPGRIYGSQPRAEV